MCGLVVVVCFKQKTAYEMRISDWSSDVCSSDLLPAGLSRPAILAHVLIDYRQVGLAGEAVVITVVPAGEIGRASCRERVCQYVSISVVAVSLKKKQTRVSAQHRSCTQTQQ